MDTYQQPGEWEEWRFALDRLPVFACYTENPSVRLVARMEIVRSCVFWRPFVCRSEWLRGELSEWQGDLCSDVRSAQSAAEDLCRNIFGRDSRPSDAPLTGAGGE
jgi:hypothetical protein